MSGAAESCPMCGALPCDQVSDPRQTKLDHALIGWAMCVQDATWEEWGDGKGEFCFASLRHATHLDEFGCPVLTPNLRAAIVASQP